ncbi:oxysterol-binding protein-related protein 4C-like protein isoform X1 [Cinnamomum micranthum f. kanehirae]|uniref:Oxysterol-binding protein-related protein 4C-like protein isoform X1 n=1 Tax=Cinnamomum micranthum f. kanehirae TaxID=337451 RepID=A0A3S3PIT0_9MAGN|nr:oxysterol-binding protein-related protein 4C-like protein isoform X1 [Cinnamomum micranthum f. kanehirae]
MQMVTEGNFQDSGVVLTPPMCLEGGLAAECRTPNMLQRILSLFKNVRPGSDLTRFELPPLFNVPKSQLQCYGESVYCFGEDILSKCSNAKGKLERFANVVAWSISTNRPLIFGVAPFNPVLGETHHASCGTLNVLLEQVSHHPPVSALHATNEKENLELVWCQSANAKFHGASVEVVVLGKRQLNLLSFGEHYEMNAPRLLIRFFPVPGVDWVGNVRIKCKDTGLEADLCYKGNSFLGLGGGSRFVTGKIFDSLSMETIYDIEGHWDRVITMTDAQSGENKVLFNAKEAISKLKTPILQDPKSGLPPRLPPSIVANGTSWIKACPSQPFSLQNFDLGSAHMPESYTQHRPVLGVLPTESALVWSEVSQGILTQNWEKAKAAKKEIEERERKLARERKSIGDTWVPKHFCSLSSHL